MCLCDRSITDEHLNIKVKSNYEYLGYKKRIMHCEEVVKHKYIYAANCMAIRNIDKNIFNIPLGVICHDSFIAYMASYYGTIDFFYEPLLYYRIHSHNLSSNFCAENSSSIIQCFVKYLKSLKRIKKSNETDGLIICDEMMKRYGLDLKLLGSPFAIYGHKYNRIKKAYELTKRDYNDGKIGSWDK